MKQCFIVVIFLTLAGVSLAAPPDESSKNKNKKAQHGQTAQVASQPPPGVHRKVHTQTNVAHSQTNVAHSQANVAHSQANVVHSQANVVQPQMSVASKTAHHFQAGQKFQPRHFSVATGPKASIPSATFRADRHIRGSEAWQGAHYQAFRNYRPQWHDRDWWRHHHHRIVFIYGGSYFWDAGWWYPAWGYDTNAYYPYDGPIYAYNDLPPDQVIGNVQGALQEQGYYNGEIDGILGPLTRAALARYQQDHGLYITSAIDPPTLQSLGMS